MPYQASIIYSIFMRNRLHEIVPTSAQTLATDIVIEPTLSRRSPELMERAGFKDKKVMLVCDANTHKALAERLLHEMGTDVTPVILENPHADEATANLIRNPDADAYIAVGSGTINDLCKYASHLEGKPYIVFPTAPSMNGYISGNASITTRGHKKSLPAQLPQAVYCDLSVIAAAPARLIRSGLGDSICRPTAQADWLLSHLLLGTPYDPLPFSFTEPYEADLFKAADKLTSGTPYAIELLMRTLLASGLGMFAAGGSYPASQGEHLIAHAMEMKHGSTLPVTYHGEQIAITTLLMAQLQHSMLEKPVRLRRHPNWLDLAAAYLGEDMREELRAAAQSKFTRIEQMHEEVNDMLGSERNRIHDTIEHVLLPTAHIESTLKRAGAPTTATELGWDAAQLSDAMHHACYMRDRFTFLDLI